MAPGIDTLFTDWADGVRVGEQPHGIASLSAQTCNGCHVGSHQSWQAGAHGAGSSSTDFLDAIREVGEETCQGCHLPLQVQRPQLVSFDGDDVNRPVVAPNPHFNATLNAEGVTCAACHVREGKIVASEPSPSPSPVHPNLTWSPELSKSESCAACHQLTWPGADVPLYDTYGEWTRSPQAVAGIQCQDCHLAAASESSLGNNHNVDVPAARALTILVDMPSAPVIRGGEALNASIRILNTGAGHSFPTGSPWKQVVVEVYLEREGEKAPERVATTSQVLGRSLSEVAPWTTTEDTRLQAGGQIEVAWNGALPQDAKPGPWWLVVRLTEEVRGVRREEPLAERRHLLRTE